MAKDQKSLYNKHRLKIGDRVRIRSLSSMLDCKVTYKSDPTNVGVITDISAQTFKRFYHPIQSSFDLVEASYSEKSIVATVEFENPVVYVRTGITSYPGYSYATSSDNDEAIVTAEKKIVIPVKNLIHDDIIYKYESLVPGDFIVYGKLKRSHAFVVSVEEKKRTERATMTNKQVKILDKNGNTIVLSPTQEIIEIQKT